MLDTIRVGVIGAGSIACRAHIPGLSPADSYEASLAISSHGNNGCVGTKVVAIADCDKAKAQAAATQFNVPKVYENWRDLIADSEIDAVSVATPNCFHAEMTIAAAQAGKHVLVEKPMATSVVDADAMIKAARKAGVILMVEQTERFSPSHEVAKDIIDSGIIGQVSSVRTRSSHQGPDFWSPGSTWFFDKKLAGFGTMADLGIHKLDLIRWLIGDDVIEVAGFADTLCKKDCEVEDSAVAVFRFSKGALGVLEAAWTTDPSDSRTFIYGSKGNIILDGPDSPIVVNFPTPQFKFNFSLPPGKRTQSSFIPNIPTASRNGGVFRHFIDCIRTGKTPLSNGLEGRNSLAVVLAALKSSETRQFMKPE